MGGERRLGALVYLVDTVETMSKPGADVDVLGDKGGAGGEDAADKGLVESAGVKAEAEDLVEDGPARDVR